MQCKFDYAVQTNHGKVTSEAIALTAYSLYRNFSEHTLNMGLLSFAVTLKPTHFERILVVSPDDHTCC